MDGTDATVVADDDDYHDGLLVQTEESCCSEDHSLRRSREPSPASSSGSIADDAQLLASTSEQSSQETDPDICVTLSQPNSSIALRSTKRPLATRKSLPPQRFFASNSPVWDLYDGNGGEPPSLLRTAEIVVVMYYAPWSARCQQFRWHFDQVARTFPPSQVRFVAVNCWEPSGLCKKQYKLYSYPVVMAYTGKRHILYSSQLSADYLFNFIENLVTPFVRLGPHTRHVTDFLVANEIALVAYFDFKAHSNSITNPPGYAVFRQAAIDSLQEDPLRLGANFAVVTSKDLAAALNLTYSGQTRLYQVSFHDDAVDYPMDVRAYTSDKILDWIKITKDTERGLKWIPDDGPVGLKSEQLSKLLNNGPLVLLLAPFEPLYPHQPELSVFRQIVHEYFDCDYVPPPAVGSDDEDDDDGGGEDFYQTAAEGLAVNEFLERQERFRILQDAHIRCREVQKRRSQLAACCHDLTMVPKTTVTHAPAYNICDVCFPKEAQPKWQFSDGLTGAGGFYSPTLSPDQQQICPSALSTVFGPYLPSEFVGQQQHHHHHHHHHQHQQQPSLNLVPQGACNELSRTISAPQVLNYCCGEGGRSPTTGYFTSKSERKVAKTSHSSASSQSSTSTSEGGGGCQQKCKDDKSDSDTGNAVKDSDYSFSQDDCRRLRLAKLLNYKLSRTNHERQIDGNFPYSDARFVGGYCKHNKSLTFAFADSRYYSYFVTKWGLNLVSLANVVIIDNRTESLFYLDGGGGGGDAGISAVRTRHFINGYLNGTLSPHRRTESQKFGGNASREDDAHVRRDLVVKLTRVTAANFHDKVVKDGTKDVVLLYSGGGWHGPSHSILHMFHSVSLYFAGLHDRIEFAIIDVSRNDLPWEYTVERVPSVVFYPARRKSDSAMFPATLPLTVPHLLAFVLARCQTEVKWRLALSVCSHKCVRANARALQRRMSELGSEVVVFRRIAADNPENSVLWRQVAKRTVQRRAVKHLLALIRSLNRAKTQMLGSMDSRVRHAAFLEWVIKQEIGV